MTLCIMVMKTILVMNQKDTFMFCAMKRNAYICIVGLLSLFSSSWSYALPFEYPASLLDAPATLSIPPALSVRVGKTEVALSQSQLQDMTHLMQAIQMRVGQGLFRQDSICLLGTEGGKPVRLWLIATDSKAISEAQLEYLPVDAKHENVCTSVNFRYLPFRLGKIGLGMTEKFVRRTVGRPSHQTVDGWMYWFSQRVLRTPNNTQELELNWLGVRVEKGKVVQAFSSVVRNP